MICLFTISHIIPTSQAGLGSIKKELELIKSIPINFFFGAGIGIEAFGTKWIELELELKDFKLNWNGLFNWIGIE